MVSSLIVVISDLHIGAGPLDDCDDELQKELVDFLRSMAAKASPVELVINGDFLDFAQSPPWQSADLEAESADDIPLCFTEQQSSAKLQAILDKHQPIFAALGAFLGAKRENTLTVLPGNHDADFFWPAIRSMFYDAVCGSNPNVRNRLRFHLERAYRSPNYPAAWIEHGHQYDPCNAFVVNGVPRWSEAAPPIFCDKTGTRRLLECVGTRFMVRFLNRLDADYPFVDNIKPFSKFLRIFGVSALVPGYGPLRAAAMIWEMMKFLAKTVKCRPRDLLGIEGETNADAHKVLLREIKKLTDEERKAFTRHLCECGFVDLDRPLLMYVEDFENAERLLSFIAEQPAALDGWPEPPEGMLGIGSGDGTLTLSHGYLVNETKLLMDGAKQVLADDTLNTVIMGHTHESVTPVAGLCYINTGSWTRYFRAGENAQLKAWSTLRDRTYETFPYDLNYAEIDTSRHDVARLITFRSRHQSDPN